MVPQALLDLAKEKEALLGMPPAFKAAFFAAMADCGAKVKEIYGPTLEAIGRRADEAGAALELAEQANEDLRGENHDLRTSLEAALKERDEQVRGKDTEIHGLTTLIKSHEDAKKELETKLEELRETHVRTELLFQQQQESLKANDERLRLTEAENRRLSDEKHSAEREKEVALARLAASEQEKAELKGELAGLRSLQDAERRAMLDSLNGAVPPKASPKAPPAGKGAPLRSD
jgi:chromosome segregation ATPase